MHRGLGITRIALSSGYLGKSGHLPMCNVPLHHRKGNFTMAIFTKYVVLWFSRGLIGTSSGC